MFCTTKRKYLCRFFDKLFPSIKIRSLSANHVTTFALSQFQFFFSSANFISNYCEVCLQRVILIRSRTWWGCVIRQMNYNRTNSLVNFANWLNSKFNLFETLNSLLIKGKKSSETRANIATSLSRIISSIQNSLRNEHFYRWLILFFLPTLVFSLIVAGPVKKEMFSARMYKKTFVRNTSFSENA